MREGVATASDEGEVMAAGGGMAGDGGAEAGTGAGDEQGLRLHGGIHGCVWTETDYTAGFSVVQPCTQISRASSTDASTMTPTLSSRQRLHNSFTMV